MIIRQQPKKVLFVVVWRVLVILHPPSYSYEERFLSVGRRSLLLARRQRKGLPTGRAVLMMDRSV